MNAQYNGQCPYNAVTLRSQEEVDKFINSYPDCERITHLEVRGNDISNLKGLKNLKFINTFKISQTALTDLSDLAAIEGIGILEIISNPTLKNLDGLQNIRKLGIDGNFNPGLVLQDNNSLQNLEGLNNLAEVRSLKIFNNTALNSIEALENLSGEVGRIEISKNSDLSNLNGLANIESIPVGLHLRENNLMDLGGLANLKIVDFFDIINERSLVNLEGLSNLEQINRYLIIQNCPSLKGLTGLESLKNTDSLEIHLKYNKDLTSLEGLQNIQQLKTVRFWGQETIKNFKGLKSLETVHGTLEIWENNGMINFTGLESLNEVDRLMVRDNSNLINFEGINSLEKATGISIHGNENLLNIKGFENLLRADYLNIQSNPNLKELCTFKNLKELVHLEISMNYNFESLHGLETLERVENLGINGSSLKSLNGLNNLSWVNSLYVSEHSELEDLQGLEKLVTIEENLSIARNAVLKNVMSLQNAKPIHGELKIEDNYALENLNGLENITRLDNLFITGNNTLRSLQALQNLETVEGELRIIDNEKLQNLNGLEGLKKIYSLRIHRNKFLIDISGLRNVNLDELGEDVIPSPFWITDNPYLTECAIANVCNYLSSPESKASIGNNGRGCSTKREVLDECEKLGDFTLPPSNFLVTSTSETCRSSNNGRISISAESNQNYTASLSGNDLNQSKEFTTETWFEYLRAGSYEICITISDYPEFEQCFTVEMGEPDALEVSSAVNMANRTVHLQLNGSTEYHIRVNDVIYRTTDDEIELNLNSDRNTISVSTDLDCQGVFSEEIILRSEIVTYPNPITEGEITVIFPNQNLNGQLEVNLFSDSGRQVQSQLARAQGGTFKLKIDGMAPGVYTLMIKSEEGSYYSRIIKKE